MIDATDSRRTRRLQPAVVHLDLDGAAHIFRIHGWRYEQTGDPLFETGLCNALDLFDELDVKATLFVIAEDLDNPRKLELIRQATDRGHEIASHSLTHQGLLGLTPADRRREIFESREKIAAELGVEVSGFRAPALELDGDCLELVAAAGYDYDSSLFGARWPGAKLDLGDSPRGLYPVLAGRQLLELPLPDYSPLPLPFHPSYSLTLGMWYFYLGLRWFRRRKAPLVLLFHLTDLADPLSSVSLPHLGARVFTLSHRSGPTKRRHCRRILETAKKHFRIGTTSQLLQGD